MYVQKATPQNFDLCGLAEIVALNIWELIRWTRIGQACPHMTIHEIQVTLLRSWGRLSSIMAPLQLRRNASCHMITVIYCRGAASHSGYLHWVHLPRRVGCTPSVKPGFHVVWLWRHVSQCFQSPTCLRQCNDLETERELAAPVDDTTPRPRSWS